ncbi:MAG TPA: sialidase family protein [Polyangiales bacterium]|nr:sialidase family protein [Polyangiales bacterium]
MSRLNSALAIAGFLGLFGCAGEDQDPVPAGQAPANAPPPGGMMVPPATTPPQMGSPTTPPTTTPPTTTPPVVTVDAGMPPSAADAGAMRDAGMPGMMDASMPTQPGNTGPLNMAPVKFGKNVKVNDDTGNIAQSEVTMATHPSGLIFVAWMDGRSNPRPCGYSVSKDGGETWSKNYLVTTKAGGSAFAGDPAAAIDDKGNLYAVCQDYASGGLGTNYVLMSHSKDQGATWSEAKRVNQSLDKPWVGATGDGTVLLTWLGNPGGMKRSTDYGETWGTPISLGYINHGTTATFTTTGLVHVAYNTNENRVTYRRSKDNGVTFEAARVLTPQGTACRSPCSPRSHPIIGADSDPTGKVVAITWASRLEHDDAEGDDDVWVIVSLDSGETWSDPIRVNDNMTMSRQFQSWVAVDSYGAIHVVWTDLRDMGLNNTYYARMTDINKGFEPNVKVNDGAGKPPSFLGDYKGIDVIGRDVVVTWTDSRKDGGDIFFARAKDAAAAGGPLMTK